MLSSVHQPAVHVGTEEDQVGTLGLQPGLLPESTSLVSAYLPPKAKCAMSWLIGEWQFGHPAPSVHRSDGVWDTLDAVQNGTPRHFGLPHDTWDGLTPAEVNRIVPLVSAATKQPQHLNRPGRLLMRKAQLSMPL